MTPEESEVIARAVATVAGAMASMVDDAGPVPASVLDQVLRSESRRGEQILNAFVCDLLGCSPDTAAVVLDVYNEGLQMAADIAEVTE